MKSSILTVMLMLWASVCVATTPPLTPTRYLIVLIHGYLGFDDSIGLINYFGEIPEVLRAHGVTVYLASVSPANTIAACGEELHQQLKRCGHERYNLIGHRRADSCALCS